MEKIPLVKQDWHLIYTETREPVCLGDKIQGNQDVYEVTGGNPPHKPSSSGRVYVRDSQGNSLEFFPSVVDAEWTKKEQDNG